MGWSFVSSGNIRFGVDLRWKNSAVCGMMKHKNNSARDHRSVAMIQSPFNEGPPPIEEYFKKQMAEKLQPKGMKTSTSLQKPILFGTGRASLAEVNGNVESAVELALKRAKESLSQDTFQLLHVTFTSGIQLDAIQTPIQTTCKDNNACYFGRSVYKKETPDQIEVLLIDSSSPVLFSVASAKVKGVVDPLAASSDELNGQLQDALAQAAAESVINLGNEYSDEVEPIETPTFLLFTQTPGAVNCDPLRDAVSKRYGSAVAYGGAAGIHLERDFGWSLLWGDYRRGVEEVTTGNLQGGAEWEDVTTQSVISATVSGKLSFMQSAVVKTWAQPAFQEPLSYMIPRYTNDSEMDLLTAIRYDDWNKFIECLENDSVAINHRWTTKQNQIPLLAACARCRTRMAEYLLERGAEVEHRNDGGFTAMMYTKLLEEFDPEMVLDQVNLLKKYGARTELTDSEKELIAKATSGRLNKNKT